MGLLIIEVDNKEQHIGSVLGRKSGALGEPIGVCDVLVQIAGPNLG